MQRRHADGLPPSAGRGAVAAADDGRSGSRVMQILAHPDDDLYFMNPEVQQTIGANDQLVSVYLNCGETGGLNKVPGQPRPKPNLAMYAGARRQGLRQAYALMATGDPHAGWGVQALALPDGTLIEVNTLAGHTGVQLVFLGVHQHFAAGRGRKRGLPDLWADPTMVTSTLVSTGSPVRAAQKITRSRLIDVLVQLLDRYRPTLVRTLDPDPDMQVHDGAHRRHHDQAGYSDHPDHTAAALFTYAALARYKGPGDGRLHAVMAYRGYYNERWPDNLPAQLVRDKAEALNAYGGAPDSCDFPAGCGDYDVGRNRSYRTGWLQRTSLRYPTAAPQVRQGPDGRLTAFAVLAGQAVRWQRTGKGDGTWTTPEPLGGDGLLPGLSATLTEDGRWQLFAERIAALGPRAADNRREIVMAEQPRRGGLFRPWASLGTPTAPLTTAAGSAVLSWPGAPTARRGSSPATGPRASPPVNGAPTAPGATGRTWTPPRSRRGFPPSPTARGASMSSGPGTTPSTTGGRSTPVGGSSSAVPACRAPRTRPPRWPGRTVRSSSPSARPSPPARWSIGCRPAARPGRASTSVWSPAATGSSPCIPWPATCSWPPATTTAPPAWPPWGPGTPRGGRPSPARWSAPPPWPPIPPAVPSSPAWRRTRR
ncbi:PIG-L family deacetylase [Streptomyces noursei]|nr:PIG-L family deacetylase [Streptomyces noursei]